jgi:glycosyltransferase involved in cell wall biosynthesis
MRVLMLAPQPFYVERGTPIAVRAAAETLARAGHEIDLLVYHLGGDVALPAGVRVVRIPRVPGVRRMRAGPSLAKLACLAQFFRAAGRLVRTHRYDLVHAVEDGVFVALRLHAGRGLPFVYDMDSLMSEQVAGKPVVGPAAAAVFERLERAACERAAHCLCVCPHLRDVAARFAPPERLTVLTDFPLVQPAPAAGDVMERVQRAHGQGRLVAAYVGNFEPYQGVREMLLSLRLLGDAAGRVRAQIYGGPASTEAELKQEFDDLVRAGSAEFCGSLPVARLGEVLGSADILLSPRREGTNTPMKLYGYLASGRPVLATSILSHTQVLGPEHAELVPPTAQGLAQGLTRLIDDPARRQSLGQAGARLVRERHSREAFERTLVGVYEGLGRLLTRS